MTTPTDALLDGLVTKLGEATGRRWERWHAWGVKSTVIVKGRPWNFGHDVNLRKADADPEGYASMVIKRFRRDLERAENDCQSD